MLNRAYKYRYSKQFLEIALLSNHHRLVKMPDIDMIQIVYNMMYWDTDDTNRQAHPVYALADRVLW